MKKIYHGKNWSYHQLLKGGRYDQFSPRLDFLIDQKIAHILLITHAILKCEAQKILIKKIL